MYGSTPYGYRVSFRTIEKYIKSLYPREKENMYVQRGGEHVAIALKKISFCKSCCNPPFLRDEGWVGGRRVGLYGLPAFVEGD